jgi:hypothetical protein
MQTNQALEQAWLGRVEKNQCWNIAVRLLQEERGRQGSQWVRGRGQVQNQDCKENPHPELSCIQLLDPSIG